MYFQPFNSVYPKIAECETRALIVKENQEVLSAGNYSFIDFYCEDKKCDCRRAMIYVLLDSIEKDPCVAVLSYGWEPKAFYRKWSLGISDDQLIWFKGPALDPFQPQTKYSQELLDVFKTMLKDNGYRQRIIRHYTQFKQKMGMKLPKDLEGYLGSMQGCGCKSGLQFRFCCGAKK